jgi:hypothetical protein
MTVPASVIGFLRKHAPRSYCDECIAQKLGLRHTSRVQPNSVPIRDIKGSVVLTQPCGKSMQRR